jgi:hypothetical protein
MKNNILIAEFLGYTQPHPNYLKASYWYKEGEAPLTILSFDTDWNWLMLVVKEVSLNSIGGGVTYGLRNALMEANIDKVYSECIEYIKFVNERNSAKNN